MTDPEVMAGHVECHDESRCPIALLFGHPGFMRAYLDMTAEEGWSVERLAEFVMALLDAGPLLVTDAVRARVNACSDPERLRSWAERALHMTDAAELFVDDQD